ncbi:hypothetical protein PLICRDRAFT_71312, partial [Plicaturopsis crispa FD-325 SS-3]
HPGRAHAACMPTLLAHPHTVCAPPHRPRAHSHATPIPSAHTQCAPFAHAPTPPRVRSRCTRTHSVRAHVHILRARKCTPGSYPRPRLLTPTPTPTPLPS